MTAGGRHRGDLSDVQRRSAATAMEVFDRLIEELDGFDGRRARVDTDLEGLDRGGTPAGPTDIPQLRAAVARTIDVYADLFRRTVELYADVVESVLRSSGPAPNAADGTGAEVALAGSPGTEAAAAVWIHNSTTAPVDAIALRMTDLTAHDGTRIAASAASFSPPRLDVGPATSRSSSLSVRVPRSAAHGTYVGHVLATGLPGTRLAVCLVVAS
jgi:hypothetical protein